MYFDCVRPFLDDRHLDDVTVENILILSYKKTKIFMLP